MHESISTIVRAFKSAVSKNIHLRGYLGEIWQRNYYERIIRNDDEFCRIEDYIQNNPQNWIGDQLRQEN